MDARTAILWASFCLNAFGVSLAFVRLVSDQLRRLVERTSSRVVKRTGLAFLVVVGLYPIAVFLPEAYQLETGWEGSLWYKAIVTALFAVMIVAVSYSLYSLARLPQLLKNAIGKYAKRARSSGEDIDSVEVASIGLSYCLVPAIYLYVLYIPVALITWRVVQGYLGVLTIYSFALICSIAVEYISRLLSALTAWIDRILKTKYGWALSVLLFSLIASLLRTLVALELFGLGKLNRPGFSGGYVT